VTNSLDHQALLRAPALLAADNFTPPTRTPWGGIRILDHYKAAAPIDPARRYPKVGESWEVSVEPDFPSRLEGAATTLSEVMAWDPSAALGAEAKRGRDATALLVKLLDAAEPLSLQIHPSDDYPELGADQAGKPESWYVLEATPDAGLYLGLRDGVTPDRMREALSNEEDVSELLFFVPVAPGDFFVIEAGTAHAIGPGLTLVEPQHVAPGRRGVTYRYWDWNRRYDADGQPSDTGSPRQLHVGDALAVTAWDRPREDALLEEIRFRAGAPKPASAPVIEHLAGLGDAAIQSDWLDVRRLSGTGEIVLSEVDTFRSLTVVGGRVTLVFDGGELVVEQGRSAAIFASVSGLSARCEGAHALLCAIP
jgi:mannose-6-phosphate isomerase